MPKSAPARPTCAGGGRVLVLCGLLAALPGMGLAQGTVPTLLVYGDLDESCPNCYVLSLLPEWYPRMQVLPYAGYDHNYFDQEGKNHWGEVMEDVIRWVRGG